MGKAAARALPVDDSLKHRSFKMDTKRARVAIPRPAGRGGVL